MPEEMNRRAFFRRLGGASVVAPVAAGLTASGLSASSAKASSPGYEYYAHGVGAQVLMPERVQFIRRHGWGTEVSQRAGTDNWFHFSIPTVAVHDHDRMRYFSVQLDAAVDQDTIIDAIDVWESDANLASFSNLSLIGQRIRKGWLIPTFNVEYGVELSVFVKWRRDGGIATFYSAGVVLED